MAPESPALRGALLSGCDSLFPGPVITGTGPNPCLDPLGKVARAISDAVVGDFDKFRALASAQPPVRKGLDGYA